MRNLRAFRGFRGGLLPFNQILPFARSAIALRGAILAASSRQNRGERSRKSFGGGFSGAFTFGAFRLTAPPQSKENYFSTYKGVFVG